MTRKKRAIENALLNGDYVNVSKKEFNSIAKLIAARKKDAVLNIRVNSKDLANIKKKARRFGIKYQTYISEILHRVARA